MNWWMVGLIWITLSLFAMAAFHAMVTIRDMDTINFDDDDSYEVDRGCDI